MSFMNAKSEKDVIQWYGWWKGITNEIAATVREAPPAPQQATNKKKKVQHQVEMSGVVEKDLEKKSSLVEDTSLPNWEKPRSNSMFSLPGDIPAASVRFLVLAWDLANKFHHLLCLPCQSLSFWDLVSCMLASFPTKIIDSLFCGLLQLVMSSGKRKKAAHEQGRVINCLTWSEFLRIWLEDRIEQGSLSAQAYKDVTDLLWEETFYFLPLQRRAEILGLLCGEALCSVKMHEFFDEAIEKREESRKEATKAATNCKQNAKLKEKNLGEVASCLHDLLYDEKTWNKVDKQIKEEKALKTIKLSKREMADLEARTSQAGLLKRLRALVNEERDADLSRINTAEQEIKDKYSLRSYPLGQDRWRNRFWKFGTFNNLLFIEDSKLGHFSVIYSQEKYNELLSRLNLKGIRENELHFKLTQQNWAWAVPASSISSLDDKSSHEIGKRCLVFGVVLDTWSLSPKAADYVDATRPTLRAFKAIDDEEERTRCQICQETISPASEAHCQYCHKTFLNLDKISESRRARSVQEHLEQCEKAPRNKEKNETEENSKLERIDELRQQEAKSLKLFHGSDSDEDEEKDKKDDRKSSMNERKLEGEGPIDTSSAGILYPSPRPESSTLALHELQRRKGPGRPAKIIKKREPVVRWWLPDRPESFPGSSFFKASCLDEVSVSFMALKAALMDIEAAIPVEATPEHTEKSRLNWIDQVKCCYSLHTLCEQLRKIFQNLNDNWLRRWLDHGTFMSELNGVKTEAQLAVLMFRFDQALCYSLEEFNLEEASKANHSDHEEPDSDDGADSGSCRVCRRSHAEDEMILCDFCDKGFHIFCLKPKLARIPRGDWYCSESCKEKKLGGGGTKSKKAAPKKVPSTKPGRKGKQKLAEEPEDEEEFFEEVFSPVTS